MNQKSNYSKFLLIWSGQLVSAVGSGLTSFGLGVYVFQKTGSAAGMALVALLAFLPVLLLSAPAGVLADRYDRRLLMMAGDGLSALGLVYILICMLLGEAKLYSDAEATRAMKTLSEIGETENNVFEVVFA